MLIKYCVLKLVVSVSFSFIQTLWMFCMQADNHSLTNIYTHTHIQTQTIGALELHTDSSTYLDVRMRFK